MPAQGARGRPLAPSRAQIGHLPVRVGAPPSVHCQEPRRAQPAAGRGARATRAARAACVKHCEADSPSPRPGRGPAARNPPTHPETGAALETRVAWTNWGSKGRAAGELKGPRGEGEGGSLACSPRQSGDGAGQGRGSRHSTPRTPTTESRQAPAAAGEAGAEGGLHLLPGLRRPRGWPRERVA